MKKIKNIALSALLTIGAFGAVTYTSCTKDQCKDVVCANSGTCLNGICSCPSGFEGNLCQTLSVTKFVKVWNATDVINGTNLVYTVAIGSGINPTSAIISNSFSDDFFSNTINATVDGNFITIPDQKPDANGDYRVQGSGTYQSNNRILWDYTLTRITDGATLVHQGTWQ